MRTGKDFFPSMCSSVIAVPPLARDTQLKLNHVENRRLIRHLEAGGIRALLYGGNAVLGHVALSEYAELLTMLVESVGAETLVIPSVGPAYGLMMDQASILRDYEFPTAMLLPTNDATTGPGIAAALDRFVHRFGRPAILYLKQESSLDIATVRSLVNDGVVACIKYAIARPDPAQDRFLREMLEVVDPQMVVSGMGEQPAVVHLRDFRLAGFTSGSVCLAPALSLELLRAVQRRDFAAGESIRARFEPVETLRDSISPVRVLHSAVKLAGICDTGPISPPLSNIESNYLPAIQAAVHKLVASTVEKAS
jgi:dihydrodipicolinate synthase/N-acetylneuraminate lyase